MQASLVKIGLLASIATFSHSALALDRSHPPFRRGEVNFTEVRGVPLYQCPPRQGIGGGSWGYYECEGQISSKDSCIIIEYPRNLTLPCSYIGQMLLVP